MRSIPSAGEEPGLLRDLVRRPGVHAATESGIFALGVLAHADHVDIGGAAVGERRADAWQQPHRAQIDVLAEALTDRKNQLPHGDVIRHGGRTDRAEIDRIERPQPVECVRGHHAARLEEVRAAPREIRELDREAVARRCTLQHLDAGGDHLLSDPVARNDRDSIGRHQLSRLSVSSSPSVFLCLLRICVFCGSGLLVSSSSGVFRCLPRTLLRHAHRIDALAQRVRGADRADHACFAGQARQIADSKDRFDARAVRTDELLQAEGFQLPRRPCELLVVVQEQSADRR